MLEWNRGFTLNHSNNNCPLNSELYHKVKELEECFKSPFPASTEQTAIPICRPLILASAVHSRIMEEKLGLFLEKQLHQCSRCALMIESRTLRFPIAWKALCKEITLMMAASIIVPILVMLLFRWVIKGFSFSALFEHADPIILILVLTVGIPAVCFVTGLFSALYMRRFEICISEGILMGRGYWGGQIAVPHSEIRGSYEVKNQAMRALMIKTPNGDVCISDKTERYSELLEVLQPYLDGSSQAPK